MMPDAWKMNNIMHENNLMVNADNSTRITFFLIKQAGLVWVSFIIKENFFYI
jgi:hypothetical protein